MKLTEMNIKIKMLIIGILTLISLLIVSVIFINKQKQIMLEEKKDKLINLVELSYSLIQEEYEKQTKGLISENDAKNNAKNIIKTLRYSNNNYVWINDDSTPFPKMIMHPISSNLNDKTLDSEKFNCATKLEFGEKFISEKEVNNLNLFNAFVEVTKINKSGFVTYLWTKPKSDDKEKDKLYEKLSYVKKFEPWGWILGTGIYIDDIQSQLMESIFETSIEIIIIMLILTFIFVIIVKDLLNKLIYFKKGLLSFFAYLNRETDEITSIYIDSNDEFGQMTKLINKNIEITKIAIEEDKKLIEEVICVLAEFEQGDLSQRLNINVSNKSLMELKNVLNNMADHLETNVNNVLAILEQYTKYNYIENISSKNLKAHLLKLATGVNNLGDSITSMLIQSKEDGLTLDKNSNILLSNVDKLNISSNEAAASLEETAAALEQITSTIRSNTENIEEMSLYSNSLTNSAINGEQLANQTTKAMEEINSEVDSINEAIAIIDQIAFQTNILSLNAAVEAATAGEAGRGFAVVAAEVRTLASRSAEAAKEIKSIVEMATAKANHGKNISTNMINGYKELNENIQKTMGLIHGIEMSSKEQLSGIEQINIAVAQLDQQTQQNAQIASQTYDVAITTDSLAKIILQNVNEKNFKNK